LISRPQTWSTLGRLGAGLGSVIFELLVSKAIGISLQREDLGMLDEAVNHAGGNNWIAEDLTPCG